MLSNRVEQKEPEPNGVYICVYRPFPLVDEAGKSDIKCSRQEALRNLETFKLGIHPHFLYIVVLVWNKENVHNDVFVYPTLRNRENLLP